MKYKFEKCKSCLEIKQDCNYSINFENRRFEDVCLECYRNFRTLNELNALDKVNDKKSSGIEMGGKKNIFIKANINSLVGLPLSFVLNITILPFFAPWFIDASFTQLAITVGFVAIPFYMASVLRQYVIDVVYEKYNIRIDPKSMFTTLYKKIKQHVP